MVEGGLSVTINGRLAQFEHPVTILEAIRAMNIDLPSPCYHEHLNNTHHCGLCVVGVKFSGQTWTTQLACAVDICDGMEIDTKFPQAVQLRNMVMSMHLLTHSLNCSVCDKAGDCFLHKFAFTSNFRDLSKVAVNNPKRALKRLGDRISIDNEQCILCGRCLSFCNDVFGEDILGRIRNEQGVDEITTYPGRECNNNYSLNLVDLCPVGAIVENDRDPDPAHRVWNLQRTPSISPESSVGINTYILHDKKHVYRIVPRKNERINQDWMTDSARELYKILEPANRVLQAQELGRVTDIRMMIAHAANRILNSKRGVYVVFSGEMSLEEQFVLKRFLDVTFAIPYFVQRTTPGDGFLISDDPYPNVAGALMMRLPGESGVHPDLQGLYAAISDGRCDHVISIYEDLFADPVEESLFEDISMTHIGYRRNRIAECADFMFPVATIFERTGTFINKDQILQKFFKAVNPPKRSILECWQILALLMNTCFQGEGRDYLSIEQVWTDMTYVLPELQEIDMKSIPLSGLILKKMINLKDFYCKLYTYRHSYIYNR